MGTSGDIIVSIPAEMTLMMTNCTGWIILYFSEFDGDRDCGVLDEDPLLDDLEEVQREGKNIFEYHGADLFPERWFRLVVVLSTGIF